MNINMSINFNLVSFHRPSMGPKNSVKRKRAPWSKESFVAGEENSHCYKINYLCRKNKSYVVNSWKTKVQLEGCKESLQIFWNSSISCYYLLWITLNTVLQFPVETTCFLVFVLGVLYEPFDGSTQKHFTSPFLTFKRWPRFSWVINSSWPTKHASRWGMLSPTNRIVARAVNSPIRAAKVAH